MREIQITKGYAAIVDDEDYEKLSTFAWYAKVDPYTVYAIARPCIDGKRVYVSMHRLLTNCPTGMLVDHINGNGLDNRKHNLRVCGNSENRANSIRVPKNKSTGLPKGVCYDSRVRSYYGRVCRSGVRHYTNYFPKVEEAVIAHTVLMKEIFGEYASQL